MKAKRAQAALDKADKAAKAEKKAASRKKGANGAGKGDIVAAGVCVSSIHT